MEGVQVVKRCSGVLHNVFPFVERCCSSECLDAVRGPRAIRTMPAISQEFLFGCQSPSFIKALSHEIDWRLSSKRTSRNRVWP